LLPHRRIAESFRKNGKPTIRVVACLGSVEDILRVSQWQQAAVRIFSATAGAVSALQCLAREFDLSECIDLSIPSESEAQCRGGLMSGSSPVAEAMLGQGRIGQ